MDHRPVAALLLPGLLASACAERPSRERVTSARARPAAPTATAAPAAEEVRPIVPGALHAGMRLTLVPNLPGVATEDLPQATRREVEVLSWDGKRMQLRWTGRVRLERPESSRRREDWVRSRAKAGAATPSPVPPAEYDEKEVGGTLDFPDFGTARSLLLPGLWPEGRATLQGCAAIWLSAPMREELRRAGQARVLLIPEKSALLTEPAASLLRRAALSVRSGFGGSPPPKEPDTWRLVHGGSSVRVAVDGREGDVPAFRGADWFGRYEVLADEQNPLVLSVLPEPTDSPFLSLFAPASVLRALLGYRVSGIDRKKS